MARIARNPNDPPVADQVLKAALRQFGKSGHDASIKVIARDAGVTAAAIYYYYRDKRELLFRGLEWMAARVLEACRPDESARGDPERALEQFVTGYIRYQLVELAPLAPMYTALLRGTRQQQNRLTPKQQQRLRDLEHEIVDILVAILESGRKKSGFSFENAKVTAFAILGMCEHTLNWVNPRGPLSIDEIVAHHVRLVRRVVSAAR